MTADDSPKVCLVCLGLSRPLDADSVLDHARGGVSLNIREKVEDHPLWVVVGSIAFGFTLALGVYKFGAENFGYKILREDDYIRMRDVQGAYMRLEDVEVLRQKIRDLEDENQQLRNDAAALRSSAGERVPALRERPATSVSTNSVARCRDIASNLAAARQQKADLDAQIDRLLQGGVSMTVRADGTPVVIDHNERQVAEKRRRSDNLNTEIISLVASHADCNAGPV